MTSLILSSDDSALAQQLGDSAAQALGYRHVDRSVLSEVASQFAVPEEKLHRLLDAAAVLRPGSANNRLLWAGIQSRVLRELCQDSVVSTGLAAHLYVRDISHVILIRVLADPVAREDALAAQHDISVARAKKRLERAKKRRAKWSLGTFGLDEADPDLYDMVISLSQIGRDKLLEIVKDVAAYRTFKSMSYSRKCLQDLALAAEVRATLLPKFAEIDVKADDGVAIVRVRCSQRSKAAKVEAIKSLAGQLAEARRVEVHTVKRLREVAGA